MTVSTLNLILQSVLHLLEFSLPNFYCITQIAGGTGITPMLQVIEAVLKNSDDKTQVGLKPLHYILPICTL